MTERKNKTIIFRVSEKQYRLIESIIQLKAISISDYCRDKIFNNTLLNSELIKAISAIIEQKFDDISLSRAFITAPSLKKPPNLKGPPTTRTLQGPPKRLKPLSKEELERQKETLKLKKAKAAMIKELKETLKTNDHKEFDFRTILKPMDETDLQKITKTAEELHELETTLIERRIQELSANQ